MPMEQREFTDEMRHVPSLDWIVTKLDYDYRDRIEKIWTALASASDVHPETKDRIDERMEAIARWLQRITTLARGRRSAHHGESDLRTSITHIGYEAVSAMSALDRNTFRRRTPFHLMESSRAELIWGAFLAIGALLTEVVPFVERVDPDIRMRMLATHAPPEPAAIRFRDENPGTQQQIPS